MGEWSRLVGEYGESIVGEFFQLIGWKSHLANLSIDCLHRSTHKQATHGIDKLFSYRDPLDNRAVVHAVTSVKYSSAGYGASPKTTFKNHFVSLSNSIECFRRSNELRIANQTFPGVDKDSNYGVLFWITANLADDQRDIAETVSSSRFPSDTIHPTILLIDNRIACFIFEACNAVRRIDANNEISFFYPRTGKNLSQIDSQSSGAILPVEFLNSPVIPFLAESADGSSNFVIVSRDNFTVDRLGGLMGLVKDITQDLPKAVTILFPDFSPMLHSNDVARLKSGFDDVKFTSSLRVGSFATDFRNTGNVDKSS